MERYQQFLMLSFFSIVLGITLILWSLQAVEPIEVDTLVHLHYNLFGEKIYDGVDVTASFDVFFILPLIFGCFLIGNGLGTITTALFYKFKK